jgi:hypothetical protein
MLRFFAEHPRADAPAASFAPHDETMRPAP